MIRHAYGFIDDLASFSLQKAENDIAGGFTLTVLLRAGLVAYAEGQKRRYGAPTALAIMTPWRHPTRS